MDKDPANVIPIDVMFEIQKMVKEGCSVEEILRINLKKELETYIRAYIIRVRNTKPIVFPS